MARAAVLCACALPTGRSGIHIAAWALNRGRGGSEKKSNSSQQRVVLAAGVVSAYASAASLQVGNR